jgi:hypothetical protein
MSDKISYSIPEFCEASGLCRSNVYEAIREGRLTARKYPDVPHAGKPPEGRESRHGGRLGGGGLDLHTLV